MTIRLISAASYDGDAAIVPKNWASLENPQEVRVQVKNNTMETDLPAGRYSLFLTGMITPVSLSFEDSEEELLLALAATTYRIRLEHNGIPASLSPLRVGGPVTVTMTADENGTIMLHEDPRQFLMEVPEGVTASIETVVA